MSRPKAALCSPEEPCGLETRQSRRLDRSRPALSSVLFAAVLAVACGEDRSALELAREAADDRDRARAIGFYQRHLEQFGDDFEARLEYTLLLGEAWAFRGGDSAPILESLERLHEEQPDNLRVKELYAMMLVREGQAAGSARRFEDAERYYQQALEVHPDVGTPYYHLGAMYDFGTGVPKDDAEAGRWYRLAADQGNANAQYNLGNMYSDGAGVPQDDAKAIRWWRLAADQGLALAQVNLGVMYGTGRGCSTGLRGSAPLV